MQNNTPIDRGRAAVVVEKYQSNQTDPATGQALMKNRYATIGKATLWPSKQNSTMPNVEIEIDTMPVGHTGPVKLYVFWDSESQQAQQQASARQAPAGYGQQQAQQSGYGQQNGGR